MKYHFYFLFFSFVILGSCTKDEPIEPVWEGLKLPANFPVPLNNMSNNPITRDGFMLGKKLFYDPILSRDNSISCGSCHNQGSAFTHHRHDISHGIDDLLGRRNSLPIQNLLWQPHYFWDGGVHAIDLISLNPIQNPVEMDEKPDNIIKKLNEDAIYPALFRKAFHTDKITSGQFLQAMSQFMAMLISANSKYDQYKRGEVNLTPDENEGLQIFNKKCSQCHQGELFSDFSFRNNGITNDFSFDKGRYEISLLTDDMGKFKVPSLRNIAKTAPYMHNGQFTTLASVLEHYNSGIKNSPTLDPSLKSGNKLGISLSDDEKNKIIQFLNTLTDEEFIHKKEFAEQ